MIDIYIPGFISFPADESSCTLRLRDIVAITPCLSGSKCVGTSIFIHSDDEPFVTHLPYEDVLMKIKKAVEEEGE